MIMTGVALNNWNL